MPQLKEHKVALFTKNREQDFELSATYVEGFFPEEPEQGSSSKWNRLYNMKHMWH